MTDTPKKVFKISAANEKHLNTHEGGDSVYRKDIFYAGRVQRNLQTRDVKIERQRPFTDGEERRASETPNRNRASSAALPLDA